MVSFEAENFRAKARFSYYDTTPSLKAGVNKLTVFNH